MNEDINIDIKRLIVHILDTNLSMPVLSDEEHRQDDEIAEFIAKHILRVIKDDGTKNARFVQEGGKVKEICEHMAMEPVSFVAYTIEIAGILFDLMLKHIDIPPSDLVCTLFELDGVTYLGILKFNYRPSFIHYVQPSETGKLNSIIKQKTALPGEGQKVDECALINLTDLSIKIVEKKYEVNGEKQYYLSTLFLNCTTDLSNKERVKIFKKATEDFNKKYFEEDFTKSAEIRTAVTESLDEREVIDIEAIAETVFRSNPEMKKAYIEHVENSGLPDKTIEVREEVAEKTFKRHKIRTDTGIEINLPVEYYKDNQKVEFVNNVDGTISIVIKNVMKIVDV